MKKLVEQKETENRMLRDMLISSQTITRVKENDIQRLKLRIKKYEQALE